MFVRRNQQIHGWVNLAGLHGSLSSGLPGSITPDFSSLYTMMELIEKKIDRDLKNLSCIIKPV